MSKSTFVKLLHFISLLPPANGVVGGKCFHTCLSVHNERRGPIWPLPIMHWTSLYSAPRSAQPHPLTLVLAPTPALALDPLHIRHGIPSPQPPWTLDMGCPSTTPPPETSCCRHWRPVQTYSLEETTDLLEVNVFIYVCLSTGGGDPMWPLPMMHWTSLYRLAPQPWSLNIRHGTHSPPLETSGGHHWRPVQTF